MKEAQTKRIKGITRSGSGMCVTIMFDDNTIMVTGDDEIVDIRGGDTVIIDANGRMMKLPPNAEGGEPT